MNTNVIPRDKTRVLVISGGGARGAWGGGMLKAIHEKEDPDYRLIVGTSTGSLLAPLVAIKNFQVMEEVFTSIMQDAIFNVNPFDDNGDVKMGQAAWRIARGKKELGKTENLKKTIECRFTQEVYDAVRATGRVIKASVVSLTSNQVAYKSIEDNSHLDMVEWLWASANQPIFMSTLAKDGELWVDGGIKENVPIVEALTFASEKGIKEIDVIINNEQYTDKTPWPAPGQKSNIIPKLLRIINIFSDEVRLSDIINGVCQAEAKGMRIYLHYMSHKEFMLCPKSLFFKPEILRKLWKSGYEHAFGVEFIPYELPGGNKIFIR